MHFLHQFLNPQVPSPSMESQTRCENDQNVPPTPIGLSYNNSIKHEIRSEGAEFRMESFSSRGYLQDFHHLDHNFSSFDLDGYDPFDAFLHASWSKDFDFDKFKVFEETDDDGAGMQNFQGATGFLNFMNTKNSLLEMGITSENIDLMTPNPLHFSVTNKSSCVTAENDHHKKSDTEKKKKCNGNIDESQFALAGRNANKSAKTQWTVEEDG